MPTYVYLLRGGQVGHHAVLGVFSSHEKATTATLGSNFFLNWTYEILKMEIK